MCCASREPARARRTCGKDGRSIKVGKDADLVLWSDNPLSIYAVAQKTIVDGIVYFDRDRDLEMRKQMQAEKARLTAKLAAAKRTPGTGGATPNFRGPRPRYEVMQTCEDHHSSHGLLAVTQEEWDAMNDDNQ